jgi:hypothetical protein
VLGAAGVEGLSGAGGGCCTGGSGGEGGGEGGPGGVGCAKLQSSTVCSSEQECSRRDTRSSSRAGISDINSGMKWMHSNAKMCGLEVHTPPPPRVALQLPLTRVRDSMCAIQHQQPLPR